MGIGTIKISRKMLSTLLQLPDDWQLAGGGYDYVTDSFYVHVDHPSVTDSPHGNPFPELVITYETMHDEHGHKGIRLKSLQTRQPRSHVDEEKEN